jgi:hypothetical protein
MRRLAAALLAAAVVTAACSDQKTDQPTGPRAAAAPFRPASSVVPGQQSDSLLIENLIFQLYNNLNGGNGPYNAAQTQFEQIASLFTVPPPYDLAAVDSNTYKLVDNVLSKFKQDALNDLPSYQSAAGTGTGAAVSDLINALLRYAGIDATVCSFATDCNFTLYQPGSPAQILTTPSGQAGVSLPPGTGTVTEPTIISVSRIDDPSVLLTTQLDQYAFRYLYTSSSGQGSDPDNPFLQPVTVEVCLQNGLTFPPGALGRLALAHDVAEPEPFENIQILPGAPGFLSTCGQTVGLTPTSSNLAVRGWHFLRDRLVSAFTPQALYATMALGTGTTGTTKNFSPFGAVDTLGFITPSSPATGLTAPEGGTVTAPRVRVVTPSQLAAADTTGPGMAGIPVTFTVTAGGGCFASPCTGSSPTTLTVNTDAHGFAAVPAWTVGAGTNTVKAAATIPCTAPVPAGTLQDCGIIQTTAGDSVLTFSATGFPASQLGFSAATISTLNGFQPPNSIAPGTPFDVTVLVQDAETPPQTVPGSTAPVTLAISTGGTLVCPSGCTQNAQAGVATFTGVYITTTGLYRLTASSSGLTSTPAGPANGINVVAPAGSAASININDGDNQTAPEGTVLTGSTCSSSTVCAPSVIVKDSYGNPVPGVVVSFALAVSGNGAVSGTPQTTGADGIARVGSWTIIAGTNNLIASAPLPMLPAGGINSVTFTATGTSLITTLVSCPPASANTDDLGRAFYVPLWKPNYLKSVTVYLSAGGPASGGKAYGVRLDATANQFPDSKVAPFSSVTNTVLLNGNTSENLPVTFQFNSPVPAGTKTIFFNFTVTNPGDGAKLSFNVGPCGLGSKNCSNLPASCTTKQGTTTETNDAVPPTSTVRRRGTGVTVRGS